MRFPALLLLGLWSFPTIACGPIANGGLDAGKGRELSYRFAPDDFSVGEHFSIEIMVCRDQEPVVDEVVKVDARMPAHGHGMNYHPTVTSPSPGKYIAHGLLLHMPGAWEFIIDIGSGESYSRLRFDYPL